MYYTSHGESHVKLRYRAKSKNQIVNDSITSTLMVPKIDMQSHTLGVLVVLAVKS